MSRDLSGKQSCQGFSDSSDPSVCPRLKAGLGCVSHSGSTQSPKHTSLWLRSSELTKEKQLPSCFPWAGGDVSAQTGRSETLWLSERRLCAADLRVGSGQTEPEELRSLLSPIQTVCLEMAPCPSPWAWGRFQKVPLAVAANLPWDTRDGSIWPRGKKAKAAGGGEELCRETSLAQPIA